MSLSDTERYSNDFDEIPEELKSAPWVMWKAVPKAEGKPTKVPLQLNGQYASVSDPNTWNTFNTVIEHVSRFDGIGFVNTPDSRWTVLDVDDGLFENGDIKPSAIQLMQRFETYTEISPSGKGLRIVLRGRIKTTGTDKIEYSRRSKGGDFSRSALFHNYGKYRSRSGNYRRLLGTA